MDTNGRPMDTYVVKCACTFRVQTESADEARQKALAQVTAAGATSIEVEEVVLRLSGQVPVRANQSAPAIAK
jgi:hypothetical protein